MLKRTTPALVLLPKVSPRVSERAVQLATYLNDHLAGSTAALELLTHLEEVHPKLADFLQELRHDIVLDRKELEALIGRLGAGRSTVRQAAAWIVEKFSRLKMKVDDPSGSNLKLLESLEAIAIGIHGKGSLWRALKVVPSASGPNYDKLIERADEQRQRIEAVRVDAARAAFKQEL